MAEVLSGNPVVELIDNRYVRPRSDIFIDLFGEEWHIESGSEKTDLGSYPWFSTWLYAPHEAAVASMWHDRRYKRMDMPRKKADQGWYEIAIVGHNKWTMMPEWKAKGAYYILRWRGESRWGT